jgi:hypothetical protein
MKQTTMTKTIKLKKNNNTKEIKKKNESAKKPERTQNRNTKKRPGKEQQRREISHRCASRSSAENGCQASG